MRNLTSYTFPFPFFPPPQEVRECDTKMQVLHVLSFVVERVGTAVRPHAPALVQYLPLLWEDAVEYNMLRAAILSTLVVLVQVCLTYGLSSSLFRVFFFLLFFLVQCRFKELVNYMFNGKLQFSNILFFYWN